MQRQALLDAGVEDASIELIPDEVEAVKRALDVGEAGDLVLVFGDDIRRTWEQITGFTSGAAPAATASPPAPRARALRPLPESALGVGEELVRDERGVHLPRREEPSD